MLRVDKYLRDARAKGISESVAVCVLMLHVLQEMVGAVGDDAVTRAVTRARHDIGAIEPEKRLRVVDG